MNNEPGKSANITTNSSGTRTSHERISYYTVSVNTMLYEWMKKWPMWNILDTKNIRCMVAIVNTIYKHKRTTSTGNEPTRTIHTMKHSIHVELTTALIAKRKMKKIKNHLVHKMLETQSI
ncbi:hypothetical protein I7I51_05720 [Histoplasma capsulatum]|uniref:Uncharacterized protein n=1 Tax=Ajellomyces capsulatus TaxID=5037 RepID=A0A8A1M5J1_AJECA|nr:hypothetical protein I7I51_05720 [Histoplasma capsulatum]